ncbi:MAG: ATP-binding cassette domain-containing protein [Xanthomonadales bacterium]|jgi:ABC-2 type transport system ATP-binding protein|nr:ATP-binding cassette domain-containing protein [Xanthomonadales bacterium]
MRPALQSEDLTRRFAGRLAVDAVSMTVPAGSVYGFLGRNGAGKTTTMKLLLGLLRADAGVVHVDGVDLRRDRLAAARRIGALLEAHGFYGHLSGQENLVLSCRLLGLPAAEIGRVLALTGMAEHRHRRVAGYSLGMRQRLGLARALLGSPPLLLLDEPTNGLDPEGIAWMRQFLRTLPAETGATVLVSSHLLGEIEQVATHVGILRAGRLVVEGRLAELIDGQPAEIRVDSNAPEQVVELAGRHGFVVADRPAGDSVRLRLPRGADLRAVSAALNQCLCQAGIAVHGFAPRRPSLEHLYHDAAAPQAA